MAWWFQVLPSAISCPILSQTFVVVPYLGPVISAELTSLWTNQEIRNWSPISIKMYCLTIQRPRKMVAKASKFTLIDRILIYLGYNHKGRHFISEKASCMTHMVVHLVAALQDPSSTTHCQESSGRMECCCLLQMSWMHSSTWSWMPTLTTSQSRFESVVLNNAQSFQVASDREAKYSPECDRTIQSKSQNSVEKEVW